MRAEFLFSSFHSGCCEFVFISGLHAPSQQLHTRWLFCWTAEPSLTYTCSYFWLAFSSSAEFYIFCRKILKDVRMREHRSRTRVLVGVTEQPKLVQTGIWQIARSVFTFLKFRSCCLFSYIHCFAL